jgi:hypothetical protein
MMNIGSLVEERRKIDNLTRVSEDRIKLDIGGCHYTTTKTTLCRFSNSLLGVMFSGRHMLPVTRDDAYFIDRDGEYFKYILNFLRSERGDFSLANFELSSGRLTQLRAEARFYGLEQVMFTDSHYTASDNISTESGALCLPVAAAMSQNDNVSPFVQRLLGPTSSRMFVVAEAVSQYNNHDSSAAIHRIADPTIPIAEVVSQCYANLGASASISRTGMPSAPVARHANNSASAAIEVTVEPSIAIAEVVSQYSASASISRTAVPSAPVVESVSRHANGTACTPNQSIQDALAGPCEGMSFNPNYVPVSNEDLHEILAAAATPHLSGSSSREHAVSNSVTNLHIKLTTDDSGLWYGTVTGECWFRFIGCVYAVPIHNTRI